MMRCVWPKQEATALLFEGRLRGSSIDYRAQWKVLTTAFGRPDLHQHDLRYHRTAELFKAGNTLAIASQVLGHSSLILHKS